MEGLNYVQRIYIQHKVVCTISNPLEADVQDIPWQIVNRKEKLNF